MVTNEASLGCSHLFCGAGYSGRGAGGGGEGGFDGVVNSIESRYHVRATRIPFHGPRQHGCAEATHGGVGDVHVAEFDNFSAPSGWRRTEPHGRGEARIGLGADDPRDQPQRQTSQTLIFMHPEGSKMGLFVLDLDGHEMDVVQVSVDPNHLNESLDKYEHHHDSDSDKSDQDGDDSD